MKRLFGILCVCLLCAALADTTALAAEVSSDAISLDLAAGSITIYESGGITYCTQNGVTQATTSGVIIGQTDATTATANTVKVSDGSCKVTISSLNIEAKSEPILVDDGSLELNLLGSSTVKNTQYGAGIRVRSYASLVIGGSGSITATGNQYSAGIGGTGNYSVGDITINSGTVTAKGGTCSAGIGGGHGGNGGRVIINGGTVTATSGSYGAGIGGGMDGSGGNITINGGEVTATGSGAGIGGGTIKGSGGIITITGGTVTATGKYGGAGIGGGGSNGGGSGGNGGTITISGGIVTADGQASGAGIGGGDYGGGGTIVITGGTVTASSGNYGAGIGGGMESPGGSVTITGGTIKASGGRYSLADVGAGYNGSFNAVTISEDATVTDTYGYAVYVKETVFIDKQPLTSAAHVGNTPVSFVSARAHSGLSYQWQISADSTNWMDLEGERAAETAVFAMTEERNGAYLRCRLTNGWGNVILTDAVQIHILAFTKQPVSVDANLDDMAAFEIASVCPNVTYQWQRSYNSGTSWADIPGKTAYMMAVNATLSENNALYRCVITATNGDQLASDSARITVESNVTSYTTEYYWQKPDGSGYVLTDRIITEGSVGSSVTAPAKTYAHFTENTTLGTISGIVKDDNSLTLARYYDRNSYTISFDMNGGVAETGITALYEATVTAPSNPTRAGYAFEGWCADEDLTEAYEFSTMPGENITVYAKWTAVGAGRGIEYKITGISLLDGNYTPISKIPTGTFYVETSVKNLSSTTMDTLVLATYDKDGRFLGMQYLRSNPPIGYTFVLGTSLNNSSGDIAKIKALMLPVLGGVVPLAESVELEG